MSEKNEKRLKTVKTIYGEEAYHKGSKVTYGTTVYVAWWILGYNTIEELEAKYTEAKYTDEQILEMHDERLRSQGIKIS